MLLRDESSCQCFRNTVPWLRILSTNFHQANSICLVIAATMAMITMNTIAITVHGVPMVDGNKCPQQ